MKVRICDYCKEVMTNSFTQVSIREIGINFTNEYLGLSDNKEYDLCSKDCIYYLFKDISKGIIK